MAVMIAVRQAAEAILADLDGRSGFETSSLDNETREDMLTSFERIVLAVGLKQESAASDAEDPGLRKAEDIADHWYQRFLTLRHEQGVNGVTSFSQLDALQHRAEGAKQVLDEIRAERKRLTPGNASS